MWLFDRRTDLLAFGGSAAVAVVCWIILQLSGLGAAELPPWGFFVFVVAVDVAHVWATAWRIYFDEAEVRLRPGLYLVGPALVWLAGVMLHSAGPHVFWRVLAYLAVYHFVRQQYGFVMWYRRRAGETDHAGELIDRLAIYSATLGPLVWWHANLPMPFHWFVKDDFAAGLPPWMGTAALSAEGVLLLVYVGYHASRGRTQVWGKHLVVGSTALCWCLSIVMGGGDLAFTIVNVLPHGVPYVVLCHRYARGRAVLQASTGIRAQLMRARWPAYLALLVVVAYVEEAVWDVAIWHDHPGLFPSWAFEVGALAQVFLVPLFALPQAWHYVLDGFIWRAGPRNPLLLPALRASADR